MQHWTPVPAEGLPDLLAFAPVPRKKRAGGWTAQRQRDFIAALAETGSVRAAAHRVDMASEGAYQLRFHPDAASFITAWDRAQAGGVRRLTDIALDRAIDGVPVPVFHKGEQVGERRWYNDRLLMFVMRHHLPDRYGAPAIGHGTKSAETIAREAAENCPVCRERAAAQPDEAAEGERWLDEMLVRYDRKITAERRHRLAGQIVAADFTLRQLTHIELVLDAGGRGMELLDRYTQRKRDWGTEELNATPLSRHLDTRRRAIWAAIGAPPRPALDLSEAAQGSSMWGGPTMTDRHKARRQAEARMAEAQALWEACGTEEGWARYCAGDQA